MRIQILTSTLLSLALLVPALSAQEQAASNMDILRDKIKADKKLLIAENLGLTEFEAPKFWPMLRGVPEGARDDQRKARANRAGLRERIQRHDADRRESEDAHERSPGRRRSRAHVEKEIPRQAGRNRSGDEGRPLPPDGEQDSSRHPVRSRRQHSAGGITAPNDRNPSSPFPNGELGLTAIEIVTCRSRTQIGHTGALFR